MSLLDIPLPTFTGERVVVMPMGDLDAEINAAERSNRAARNWARRAKSGGGARIDGQTRMQIVYAVIAEKPGCMPREISKATGLDPSPVYVAIRWLRNGGFIETRDWCRNYVTDKPAPQDQRGVVGFQHINAWRARKAA